MFLFLTYYFQITLGYSPLKSGFAFLPFSGGIIVAAGVASQLLPKIGPRPLMIPGLVMAIAGMLLLLRIDQNTSYVTHVLPAQLLMSVGLAGVVIPASSTARIGVGPHDAGVASAVLNSLQQVGARGVPRCSTPSSRRRSRRSSPRTRTHHSRSRSRRRSR
jgi:hypothetical protein